MAGMKGGVGSMINKAAASQPRSGHKAPASGAKSGSGVGNETKAAIRAAGLGATDSVVGTTSLSAGVGHLKKEHPESYSDCGPHQGGTSHITHMPLHGLKPGKM